MAGETERAAGRTAAMIDTHVHFVPDSYRQALKDAGKEYANTFPTPAWDMESHLRFMDEASIGAAVVTISSPDAGLGGPQGRRWSRECNEAGAGLVQAHPDRFGFFATLPLPDVEGALEEMGYAFDVLKADGVRFYSNSGGVYLGDPLLDPVFDELDGRGAVCTIHPVGSPAVPANVLVGIPIPLFEFHFDTTRAVANMLFNRTLERFSKIRMIVPHMGALLPLFKDRMGVLARQMVSWKVVGQDYVIPDFEGELARLYYDFGGGFNYPLQIPALSNLAGPDRWLGGTDYPHTPVDVCKRGLEMLRNTDLLSDEQVGRVLRGNALGLWPRFS